MISILIPIYNGIEYIDDSVTSVLKQTYTNWELIIGINGHPPNSAVYQKAKEYESKSDKIRVIDYYPIRGKSNTLNEMIKHSRFDYIALLDVDDIWNNNKLEVQSKLLDKYDVIGSNCIYFGDIENRVPPILIGDISEGNFASGNPMVNSSSVIRKELCYWNSSWDGIEDYDMWLRLRKQNKKFFNFKEVLVKHRIHNDSAFNAKGNGDKVEDLLHIHGYKR
jgi:glycosyltransferase involved in cell wall biosynthesis